MVMDVWIGRMSEDGKLICAGLSWGDLAFSSCLSSSGDKLKQKCPPCGNGRGTREQHTSSLEA